MQARYLSAFEASEQALVLRTNRLFGDLGSEASIRVNEAAQPTIREAEALVEQSYEFNLILRWRHPAPSPVVIAFDVKSEMNITVERLSEILPTAAQPYFGDLVLVFHSLGRAQNLQAFPLLFDLENVIRELVIYVMSSVHGPDWWDSNVSQDLVNKAERYMQYEEDNLWYRDISFHPVFYLDLKDLRELIESEDRNSSSFSEIFGNYDQVHVPDKIGQIRGLRNVVMHGRYLREVDFRSIQVICDHFDRFLRPMSIIGDFSGRDLRYNQ
jgi:hypothetical protein